MTNQEIITRGELIRDETVTGANTAQRVGEAFVAIGENLKELANRDNPIVFTENKAMNVLIKTLFLDVKNYNGEVALDTNSIYCKYYASNNILGFYTAASGGTNFLNIVLSESVVCATISNGIFYYVDIDFDALPTSDTSRFKITTSAFSEAYNPKNLNDGYTTNPVLNKYIKQIWVEIPDDYSGDLNDILNKLCIYSLSNLFVNGEYKQKLTISVFGSGYATFYYSNGTGEVSTLDIAGYQTYSELTLHIDIDWKSLRGKEYKNRFDYLTQKAYEKGFFVRQVAVSDETGDSPVVAISQKWAKEIDGEVNEIKAQLPETEIVEGEFVQGYYSTANKKTIGEPGQTASSASDSSLSCLMLTLDDSILSVSLKVGGISTAITLRPYYFLDEDNILLFIENDTTNIIETTITKDNFPTNPNNGKPAKYLYVNNFNNKVSSPSVTWKKVAGVSNEEMQEQIDELRKDVPQAVVENLEFVATHYYDFSAKNIGSRYSAVQSNLNAGSCLKFKIEYFHESMTFTCRGTQYVLPFCILDEENILLYKETSHGISSAETFTLTRDGDIFILSVGGQTTTIVAPKWICVNNYNSQFASPSFVCVYRKFNQLYEGVYPSFITPYLFNKKVLMLGDSITEFVYTPYYGAESKGIVEHFSEFTKTNVVRGGIGASGLTRRANVSLTVSSLDQAYANTDVPSIVDALCTGNWDYVDAGVAWQKENNNDDNEDIINGLKEVDMSKIDIITIFAGTNDWRRSRLVVGDTSLSNLTDITNINGAINYIVKTIHEAYPNIAIYFFSPIVRALSRNDDVLDSFSDDADVVMARPSGWEGEAALHLYDVANAIAEAAKRNHCPCCNLYFEMGWDKYNFLQFLAQSPSTDGTHPTRGFAAIAHKMATFILSNICR